MQMFQRGIIMAFFTFERKDLSQAREDIEYNVSNHKVLYTVEGIIFILAGIFAFFLPEATALGFNFAIGILLIVGGLFRIFFCFNCKKHWWAWLSPFVAVIVGSMMLIAPVAGVIALATLLGVFLLMEGIAEIFLALELRYMKNWGWLIASGGISLLLAILVFAGWPNTTVMFLSIVIGLNLIMYGSSLLALVATFKQRTP